MLRLEINFSRQSLGIVVFVWNQDKNKFEKLNALFDTGAHTCSIDSDLYMKLGYNFDDATRSFITTATKINEEVKRVRIDKLKLDDTEINSVLFNTYEFPLVSYPVILGMNVIRHFKVTLNFKDRLITMNKNYADINDDYYDTDIYGDWRTERGI